MLVPFAEIDHESGCFRGGVEDDATGETFYLPSEFRSIAEAQGAARGILADAHHSPDILRKFLGARQYGTLH